MDYGVLGRSGVQVSQLCFGTMSFGGDADEAMSERMYRACRDAGINFFDTADQYNQGRSEEILGKLIRGQRDELVITTKCFNPTGSDVNARGGSRRHVSRAVEASLKRLGTDRVEILFLHQQDALTPLEETARAMEDLVLPMAAANGIGVMPYSPAGGGLLSGKYAERKSGRLTTNKMYEARYGEAWMHEVAASFAAFCRERGFHPMSLAVAWVGAHPVVTAPIIGARSVEQLQASLDSVKIDLTPELRAQVSALSRTPPPATDRSEESQPKT